MTDFLQDKILGATLHGDTWDVTATALGPYAALHSTECSESSPGTELSGNVDLGYQRWQVSFDPPSAGSITNSGGLSWAPTSGTWTTYVSIGFYDSSTEGNLLYYTNSILPKTLSSGDYSAWQVGEITLTLT
jgi:hypothetical protein